LVPTINKIKEKNEKIYNLNEKIKSLGLKIVLDKAKNVDEKNSLVIPINQTNSNPGNVDVF
jgi:hypothetical protein